MTEQANTDAAQTQLVVIEPTTAVALFTEGTGVAELLAEVRQKAVSLVPDVTTKKGRDEIKSLAYLITRTKTYLDGFGKELNDKYKEIPKRIDANRKTIRDTLDALKEEVRAPLTKFEEIESARVAALQDRLTILKDLGASGDHEFTAADLQTMLLEVEQTALDDTWQELLPQATVAKELATKRLSEALAARQKYEAEQAELELLRQKQAEQERIDRERLIAEQAAEQARRDAEAADLARQRAEANATRLAEEAAARAAEQERQRIANEQRLKDEADAARAADVEHRRTINKAILMDLMGLGIEEEKAINLIKNIANNKIDHLSISY